MAVLTSPLPSTPGAPARLTGMPIPLVIECFTKEFDWAGKRREREREKGRERKGEDIID